MQADAPVSQVELTTMSIDRSRENYRSRLTRAVQSGAETTLPPIRRLLQVGVAETGAGLEAWIKEQSDGSKGRPHDLMGALSHLKVEEYAAIATQVVLDQLSTIRSYLSLAYSIGRAVEEECRFALIEREDPTRWKDIVHERDVRTHSPGNKARKEALWAIIRERCDDILRLWEPWTRRRRYRLGTLLIELLGQRSGIIEVQYVPTKSKSKAGHKQAVVVPTAECVAWLSDRHSEQELLTPYYLPTAIEPLEWTTPEDGGYPGNVLARRPLFHVKRKRLRHMTKDDMPRPYEAVNHVQGTAWRINEPVRQVAEYLWRDLGGGVAGLPSLDPEVIPPTPSDEDFENDTQVAKDWKRTAAIIHGRNRVHLSKRVLVAKTLQVANLLHKQPFWFPHKYDFRGRLYPIASTGLSPQGTDLSRGLLDFSAGMVIDSVEARDWHYIHGANCWGFNKVPFAQRCEWVLANEKMIRAVSEDPFGAPQWCDASEPFQFLAWCFDVVAYWDSSDEGKEYESHLPIAMDGSNNGLQLYALLARDPICAFSTNVSETEEPQDIYQDVADVVTSHLRAALRGTEEELDRWTSKSMTYERIREYAADWLDFLGGQVTRDVTKRPVMVLPYGGTPYSCREYVAEWFDDERKDRGLLDKPPFTHAYLHTVLLSRMVWAAIDGMVAAPVKTMAWLQNVADLYSVAGLPIEWTTPSGFKVHQVNFRTRRGEISLRIGGKMVYRRSEVPTGKISSREQRNGIAPNFVHALDASVLCESVLMMKALGVQDLGVVHDSFATHAANAHLLASGLRESVYRIFKKDLLAQFHQTAEAALGHTVPEPPPSGGLNVECVLRSTYFYS